MNGIFYFSWEAISLEEIFTASFMKIPSSSISWCFRPKPRVLSPTLLPLATTLSMYLSIQLFYFNFFFFFTSHGFFLFFRILFLKPNLTEKERNSRCCKCGLCDSPGLSLKNCPQTIPCSAGNAFWIPCSRVSRAEPPLFLELSVVEKLSSRNPCRNIPIQMLSFMWVAESVVTKCRRWEKYFKLNGYK